MKIGIDIDDVVVDFMKHYLEHHNSRNGTALSLEDIDNYHLWKAGIHSSKEESIVQMDQFLKSKKFDDLTISKGSDEAIKKLSDFSNILFITSRPSFLKNKTRFFIENNFSFQNFELLHSGEIYGGKTKADICKDRGVEVLIEDNPDYSLSCAKEGIKVFLMDKPWNRGCEHENIVRVKGWNEILEKLK